MEKEKQLKEFDFHGLKLIGVYNPNLDSWWFRGKEVYRCLGVSKRMFSYYMKQVDDKHKDKVNIRKINDIFRINNYENPKDNHYEWLISESGLYNFAACLGRTEECMDFRNWLLDYLPLAIRKAEQETLQCKVTNLEAEKMELREEINRLNDVLEKAEYLLSDTRYTEDEDEYDFGGEYVDDDDENWNI